MSRTRRTPPREGQQVGHDEIAATALRECERVLHQNWRVGEADGNRFAYTCPSPTRYPWQWYWDSCLSAVAWRRFDRDRSRALESLLEAAEDDGFIGHTIFWGKPVRFPRLRFYNVRSRHDRMTATIQPPLLAWARKLAVGDPAAEPRIVRHHEALSARRDLEGDGLLGIIQPDESGLDASPAFDSVWGWRCDGLPGFPLLVAHNRRLGFDARRVRADGGPLVCSPLVNVIHASRSWRWGAPRSPRR